MERLYVDTASEAMQPLVERQRTPVNGFHDSMLDRSEAEMRRLIEELRHANLSMSISADSMSRDMMVVRRSNEIRIAALEKRIGENHARRRNP
jgi:hypothetical protein